MTKRLMHSVLTRSLCLSMMTTVLRRLSVSFVVWSPSWWISWLLLVGERRRLGASDPEEQSFGIITGFTTFQRFQTLQFSRFRIFNERRLQNESAPTNTGHSDDEPFLPSLPPSVTQSFVSWLRRFHLDHHCAQKRS